MLQISPAGKVSIPASFEVPPQISTGEVSRFGSPILRDLSPAASADQKIHQEQSEAAARILRMTARDSSPNHVPVDSLVDMPGARLTSALLRLAHVRSDRRMPTQILDQYENDRFVRIAPVDAVRLAEISHRALAVLSPNFEATNLAPLAPFGIHAAVAKVSQNNVVTTMRGNEVAADPTTTLALEAAVRRRIERRRNDRSDQQIRLSAVQRVTRAQQFSGPRSFAHFTLLGLVTAGRDSGNQKFELEALIDHVTSMAAVIGAVGLGRTIVRLTSHRAEFKQVLEQAKYSLEASGLDCRIDQARSQGRTYYTGLASD